MAFVGYRAGRAAGGGALNGYTAPKAKQEWVPGAVVKVGFLTLQVVAKVGADWRLQNANNGKRYLFTPHMGLSAGWEA